MQKSNRVYTIEHVEPDLTRTFIPQDGLICMYMEYGTVLENGIRLKYQRTGQVAFIPERVALTYVENVEGRNSPSYHSEYMTTKHFIEKTQVLKKPDDRIYERQNIVAELYKDIL